MSLLVEDELVAVLSIGYHSEQEFPAEERLFLTTVADLAAQALGRARRSERLRAESRRHRLLSATQAAINRRLNPLDQLRALAGTVVPELADFSTVHVLATPVPPGVEPRLPVLTDRVASQSVPGVEPAPLRRGIAWFAGEPIVETIRSGGLLYRPAPSAEPPPWAERAGTVETLRTGLNHLVFAPVLVDGLVVAIATFGMCHDRPTWDPEDLAIVETIAGHAAVALEHGLDYQHTRETALVLQRQLLGDPPDVDGLQICVRYQPAGRDVVGHDIHAAAAMGQLRAALRALSLDEFFDPGTVLQNLGQVNDSLQAAAFATALFARLARTPDGWELTWATAGHPPPLLVQADGCALVLDQAASGVALVPGLDLPRRSARVTLQPGSTVLLYTDGLVERRGVDIGESIAAVAARAGALVERPIDQLCDTLLRGAAGHDDVALLAVRVDAVRVG
ncbi:MAG: SpoIIE family protein phosphatase [Sporichthyaceae bacterium]